MSHPRASQAPVREEAVRLLARPGENCWRFARARRFACLVDGDAYFRALHAAISAARRSVFVLGWDIDSRVELLRPAPGGVPVRFADFLEGLVRARRDLEVFVLTWDYAAVYALERDPLTRLRMRRRAPRIHFRYDDRHPLGASHHQKVIVVDDAVAFSGGLDVTSHRWDTPAHEPDDPLRTTALGKPHGPFHDVQAIADGEVARALGELVRERWARASRRRTPPLAAAGAAGSADPWPAEVVPDLEDVDVAIARTQPAFGRVREAREVERLFLDTIAAARETIYVENQYLTSGTIGEALAARLEQEDGPEVVVVGPQSCSGWLEQKTMGALRVRVLQRLESADRHGRLRIVHPVASRSRGLDVFVHSKVMVVDDEVLRIGSANLSNRSLGLDTECDLAVVAGGDARARAGIARVRARLAAEHLGVEPGRLERELERNGGSLAAAFDALGGGERGVVRIAADPAADEEPIVPAELGVDPSGPLRVTRAIDRFLPEIVRAQGRQRRRLLYGSLFGMLATLTLAAAGGLPPVGSWPGLAGLRERAAEGLADPLAVPLVLLLFVAGSLLLVPQNLLVLATVLVFRGAAGGALAFAGAFGGALATYALGRWLGPRALARLAGTPIARLIAKLRGRGFVSVALLRVVPVAPATLVHLACGSARVPFAAYAGGTAIGLLPSVLALAIFGDQLGRVLRRPTLGSALVLIAIAAAIAWAFSRARRILATHPGSESLDVGLRRLAHD